MDRCIEEERKSVCIYLDDEEDERVRGIHLGRVEACDNAPYKPQVIEMLMPS